MKIDWRNVHDLLLFRQTLLIEFHRVQAVLAELQRRRSAQVAPDITVSDLQDIFSDERERLLAKLDEVDAGLRHLQENVAGDLVQHNRLIELWRRSLIIGRTG